MSDPMPDDRPESPQPFARDKIHAALSHLATAKMAIQENYRQVAITAAMDELSAALAALSTPAGPSPATHRIVTHDWTDEDGAPQRSVSYEPAAPSPREEAVETDAQS